MLKEQLPIIQQSFLNYFADGRLFVMVLIAVLCLLVEEKEKDNRNYLLYYTVIIFLLFVNPIFCYMFAKVISINTYYRFLWLIPIGIIIAYFGAILITKTKKQVARIIGSIFFIGILIYSGKCVYCKETFEKIENLYKIQDEIVEVVNVIHTLPTEHKKAMVSIDLVGSIRQLDASIKLPYGRRPYGDYEDCFPIVTYYNNGDVENLMQLCQEQNVNIIVYDNKITLSVLPSSFGYELYAQTSNYDIYVLKEN